MKAQKPKAYFTRFSIDDFSSKRGAVTFTLYEDQDKKITCKHLIVKEQELVQKLKGFLLENKDPSYALAFYSDRILKKSRFYIVDEKKHNLMYNFNNFLNYEKQESIKK